MKIKIEVIAGNSPVFLFLNDCNERVISIKSVLRHTLASVACNKYIIRVIKRFQSLRVKKLSSQGNLSSQKKIYRPSAGRVFGRGSINPRMLSNFATIAHTLSKDYVDIACLLEIFFSHLGS